MRGFTFLCLLAVVAVLPYTQAAPVPKSTMVKPAVIDARTENNVAWVLEGVAICSGGGLSEDKKVAELDIVRGQKDREAWLRKNIRVERVKNTNLVRVSFQDGNAKEQAAIVNAVVDYYLNRDVRERRNQEKQSLERSKARLDKWRRNGKLTPEEAAKWEEELKKDEEYIRTFPALVEHAKAP